MTEQIVDIKGFEGVYRITSQGQVFSVRNNRYLKPSDDGHGYRIVILSVNGVKTRKKVHRLVAEAFLTPIDGKNIVNHKDRNPSNNNVENLEWCTISENIQHGYDTNPSRGMATGYVGKFAEDNHTSIFVMQFGKDLEPIKLYGSMMEAQRQTCINNSNISKVCDGDRKTAGGYGWKKLERIAV